MSSPDRTEQFGEEDEISVIETLKPETRRLTNKIDKVKKRFQVELYNAREVLDAKNPDLDLKDPTDDHKMYLSVWVHEVTKCHRVCTKFLHEVEICLSRLQLEPDSKTSSEKLLDAIIGIETTFIQSLDFYRLSIKLVPLDVAISRIKASFGNFKSFVEVMKKNWWEVDAKTVGISLLAFFGPTTLAVGAAVLLGLSGTGFGLVIAAGILVGGALVGLYKYRKSVLKKVEMQTRQAQLESKQFFERWNNLNAELDVFDLDKCLKFLNTSQKAFDSVKEKMFPEIRLALQLREICSICLDSLLNTATLHRIKPSSFNIQEDYKSKQGDIVCSSRCSKEHLFHFECLSNYARTKGGLSATVRCPTCQTETNHWKAIYRSDVEILARKTVIKPLPSDPISIATTSDPISIATTLLSQPLSPPSSFRSTDISSSPASWIEESETEAPSKYTDSELDEGWVGIEKSGDKGK